MNLALAVMGTAAVVLGLVTAVFGWLNQRHGLRAIALSERTEAKVQTVSVLINGHLSALLQEVAAERVELERYRAEERARAHEKGAAAGSSHGDGPLCPSGECNAENGGPDDPESTGTQ